MKNILLFSAGNTCRSMIAEALLRQQFSNCMLNFYSCGINYLPENIEETQLMLRSKHIKTHTFNIKHYEEIVNHTFDATFVLFNYLTEKATPPPCEGTLFYIGYKGLGKEYCYNDVKHKILYKIKNVLDKEFDQRVTL